MFEYHYDRLILFNIPGSFFVWRGKVKSLQAVVEELVHLGDAGGDGEVDGAVADFDDESTDDVGVNLVGDLELLAGADVGGLGDGGLEAGEGPAVEVLLSLKVSHTVVRGREEYPVASTRYINAPEQR